jgi:hypothetical protein
VTACAAPPNPVDAPRAWRLIHALAAADRTLEELSPALKRALSHERRPLNRDPPAVRRELALARRLAGDLSRRLAEAHAALPAEGDPTEEA